MSGPTTVKEKLAVLAKRADWLERRVGQAARTSGPNRSNLSYDRAELSALRWALGVLGSEQPGRTLDGLDFVIVGTRHAADCECDDPADRQVAVYPASEARLVADTEGPGGRVIVKIDRDQTNVIVCEGVTYRAGLVNLVADPSWQPGD